MWWPSTMTYIFKVSRPWLWKSCPLCSIYSTGWILFIFSANNRYYKRVCRVLRFFRICKFEFLANFRNFLALTLKKKSTVLDGFFPCLAQMITSMRGCVAYNEFWPWPISSRSLGLGLENHVRSVASTVLDGFFLYLIQIITTIRGCVACYVNKKNPKFQFFAIFSNFLAFTLKKHLQFCLHSFHIWHKSS